MTPKARSGINDPNRNDYALPYEISFSSKTWFPEILSIKIHWVKALNWPPMEFQHILYLKKGGTRMEYEIRFPK